MAAEVTIDFLSSFVDGEGRHGVRERIRAETTTQWDLICIRYRLSTSIPMMLRGEVVL